MIRLFKRTALAIAIYGLVVPVSHSYERIGYRAPLDAELKEVCSPTDFEKNLKETQEELADSICMSIDWESISSGYTYKFPICNWKIEFPSIAGLIADLSLDLCKFGEDALGIEDALNGLNQEMQDALDETIKDINDQLIFDGNDLLNGSNPDGSTGYDPDNPSAYDPDGSLGNDSGDSGNTTDPDNGLGYDGGYELPDSGLSDNNLIDPTKLNGDYVMQDGYPLVTYDGQFVFYDGGVPSINVNGSIVPATLVTDSSGKAISFNLDLDSGMRMPSNWIAAGRTYSQWSAAKSSYSNISDAILSLR